MRKRRRMAGVEEGERKNGMSPSWTPVSKTCMIGGGAEMSPEYS